jgi:ribosomal protein S18 acetylase RimI-like enzyme
MKNNVITYRQAGLPDALVLQQVARQSFYESFAEQNTDEDMQQYLDGHFNLAQVEAELRDPRHIFILAYAGEQAVGYTKLRHVPPPEELGNSRALEMERLYVLKAFHDQKVGALLMQQGIAYAKQQAFQVLWLGVWEHNARAIRFYERWGFETFGSHLFILGNDEQTDLLMKKQLD